MLISPKRKFTCVIPMKLFLLLDRGLTERTRPIVGPMDFDWLKSVKRYWILVSNHLEIMDFVLNMAIMNACHQQNESIPK